VPTRQGRYAQPPPGARGPVATGGWLRSRAAEGQQSSNEAQLRRLVYDNERNVAGPWCARDGFTAGPEVATRA